MLLPDQDIHDFIFLSQLYTSCFGTGEENVFYSRLLVFHVHTCTLTLNGELIAEPCVLVTLHNAGLQVPADIVSLHVTDV